MLLTLVAFVLSLFAGRLVQLQGLEASTYAQAARDERLRTVTLPATRGAITDADGEPLATTAEAYHLTVDQTQVVNPAAYALQLEPLLRAPAIDIQRALTGADRFAYVEKRITPETWRAIRGLSLPGLYTEPAARRVYPAGTVAGNLVGFVGAEGHGLAGLEMSREKLLAGDDGSLSYEVGAGGQRLPIGDDSRVEPEPGKGLRLTIDRDLQWRAQQALADQVKAVKAKGGSAVVMDPATGDILAMATAPSVDPRNPGKTPRHRRGNAAVEDAYEPGSVQKVITAAALLEERLVTPDTPFSVPMTIRRADRTIGDAAPHPTGLTFAGIIAKSSNVGTLMATERIETEVLAGYLERFGYGTAPGLGFAGESPGLLPATWSGLTRDTVSFGQTLSASIVQMASAFSTIANGGVRVPPRLIDAVVEPDGTVEEQPAPEGVRVVSERTAAAVTRIMEGVMGPDGTGKTVQVPGYRVAGKTGTAQRVNSACGCYDGGGNVVSFMGFAPAEQPEVVVAVTIDRAAGGGSGGRTAGPVWADITGFALHSRGVPPSTEPPPSVRLFTE